MTVTIYSTPTCVYCHAARKFLAEHNVEYSEKNVALDDEARNYMIDKSGQMGVPVIEIDGKIIVGFNKQKLAEFLNIHL